MARRNSWQSEGCECFGVGLRLARMFDDYLITACLPFQTYPARQPPDDRMIKEQRLDDTLEEIDQIVPAPHMCQFMEHDHLDLLQRTSRQDCRRQQDDRAKNPDQYGRADKIANCDHNSLAHAQGLLQPF